MLQFSNDFYAPEEGDLIPLHRGDGSGSFCLPLAVLQASQPPRQPSRNVGAIFSFSSPWLSYQILVHSF